MEEAQNDRVAGRVGGNGEPTEAENSEALKKCLEENKDDKTKCQTMIDAFKGASADSIRKPLSPLWLRSGSLTDV